MKIHKGEKVALIWGADSVLGSKLIDLLLFHSAYDEVKILTHQKLSLKHRKLKQFQLKEGKLIEAKEWFYGNDLFLISVKEFHNSLTKKELHSNNCVIPSQIAKMCLENGVNQVLCLSNYGANENSPLFPLRILGALEKEIKKMDFWAIHFFQPVFLMKKQESTGFQRVFIKTVDKVIEKITGSNLNKLKPMHPQTIAQSMISAAQKLEKGVFYHTNEEFQKIEDLNEELSTK